MLLLAQIIALLLTLSLCLGLILVDSHAEMNDDSIVIKSLNLGVRARLHIKNAMLAVIRGEILIYGHYLQSWDEELPNIEEELASSVRATFSASTSTFDNRGVFVYDYAKAEVMPRVVILASEGLINSDRIWIKIGGKPDDQQEAVMTSAESELGFLNDVLLHALRNFINWGQVTIYGVGVHPTRVRLHVSDGIRELLGGIQNYGQVCLKRAHWAQSSHVRGSGCVIVGEDSLLELYDDLKWGPSQDIVFDIHDQSAIILINTSLDPGLNVWNVYGFRKRAQIQFESFMNGFKYRGDTLEVFRNDGVVDCSYSFRIGHGYDPKKFEFTSRSITYLGAISIKPPPRCTCDFEAMP